jgi:hypothetical protein
LKSDGNEDPKPAANLCQSLKLWQRYAMVLAHAMENSPKVRNFWSLRLPWFAVIQNL